MVIAFDTNAVYTSQAGVARYVRGLLGALQSRPPAGLEISPIAWPVENLDYAQPRRAWRTFYRELCWGRFVAPGEMARMRACLLHGTVEPFMQRPAGVREVLTLHDLALLRHPERFRAWHRRAGTRRLQKFAQADHVICISRFTADEAMRLLGLPAKQMTVIYNGCDFTEAGGIPAEQPLAPAAPEDFFLFVGSLEPGKNLALLKEVYQLAAQQGVTLPPLLIVGARWEGVAGEGAPPADWHYLGRQPDAVLVHLYRRARALVFPSKYEGFGLPVVEAQALGCPVICSRVASLPEVGGDAALYAEQNATAYLAAMRRLMAEPGLRADLMARGRAHAQQYTWRRCAEETAAIYRQVLERA